MENRCACGAQCGTTPPEKQSRPEGRLLKDKAGDSAALFLLCRRRYAVSPYTVTVISTTTSVCNCTLTVVSLTVLIGPLGRRTCDLATS